MNERAPTDLTKHETLPDNELLTVCPHCEGTGTIESQDLGYEQDSLSPIASSIHRALGATATHGEPEMADAKEPRAVPPTMSRAGRKVVDGKTFYLVPGRSIVISANDIKSNQHKRAASKSAKR